jgi:hypothetical protein
MTYSTNASPFDKETPKMGKEIPEIEHVRWKKWVGKAGNWNVLRREAFLAENLPSSGGFS